MNGSQLIIVGLSLLQTDVHPLIDVPTVETYSTLLLNLMDSPYNAHMAVHFACWTLPIPRCDDLIIGATTLDTLCMFQMLVVFQWMLHFIVMPLLSG